MKNNWRKRKTPAGTGAKRVQTRRQALFAVSIVPQAAERSNPATTKQVEYLAALRQRCGLDVWNSIKTRLAITRPGTLGLGKREAAALIAACVSYLEGGE